jgi:hypothetical protein
MCCTPFTAATCGGTKWWFDPMHSVSQQKNDAAAQQSAYFLDVLILRFVRVYVS